MSTIEKMSIQGIRSFGPDANDVQKIQFYHPLTLILGPNGTGKTTIIECLKYATTGDMPPGIKTAGAAFIHDPKLAREREIKAQVKLMIKDMTGASCTVERSLVSEVKDAKGKKLGFKTLDGVISRTNREGVKQSITSRCADLNREMVGALGVSKAVVESVIFCHQEESNWPLGEGKTVKDRFDAIFASTRYTKVLDEIKKIKLAQDQEIKLGKEELKYLKQHKDKAYQFEGDINQLKSDLEASEDEVGKIKEKLKPVKEQLEQIKKNSADIHKVQSTLQENIREKKQLETNIRELSENIEQEFEGSTHELKRELKQFSAQVQDKKDELTSLETQQETLAVELEKLAREKNQLLLHMGKLQQESDTNEANIKRRDSKIWSLAEEYDFDGIPKGQEVTDENYMKFFQNMKEKLGGMMDTARRKKTEFEAEEAELQKKIDGLKESKTKLEHSEKMKKEMMAKNEKEIQEINRQLKHMAASASRLTSLRADLKRAEKDLETTESSLNQDGYKAEIKDLNKQKENFETSINDLNSEMSRLTKQSSAQAQLDMLMEDQEKKQVDINRLKSMHEDNVTNLLGHMPVEDLRMSLETYITNQTENVRKCQSGLGEQKVMLSTKEGERKSVTEQLRQKEGELRRLEEEMFSVCDSQDLEEGITEVQKKLTQAQEEKGSLMGADLMIKKYIKNLEKNNPCCPLCHRGFNRDQEVRELILKLKEQLRKVPHNIQQAEEEMEKFQKKYDELMQLKPQKKKAMSLKEEDVPVLKAKVKKLDEEIKRAKEAKENRDDQLMSLEVDLDMAKEMHPDIVLMDRYKGEVRDLERKITGQREMLSVGGSLRSLDQVIAEKEEKQLELDTLNRNLRHKMDKLSQYQEEMQKLSTKVNTLKGEKLTIEGELQQRIKLEESKASLTSDNTNNQKDIDEARHQLQPIERQIQKLLQERNNVTEDKERMSDEARAAVDYVKNKGNEVKNFNNDIKAYIQSGKKDRLVECQERQSKLTGSQRKKEEEQEEVGVKLNELRKEIASQQIHERELQDSLQLRKKQGEVRELDLQIDRLKTELGDMDVEKLESEHQRLRNEEEALAREYQKEKSRQQSFQDQIERLQQELKSDMYKDVEKKFSSRMYQTKTTEIVNGDLQKYYKAMEIAIMRYHQAKMKEINQIIQEIWRNTYRGNDIETIEIRSEDDDTAQGMKTRKSYNYRVVMIKNNIPIDMRGRCSAGQKVLASLIIRLALAETFCVNCGVLALDEPTTNLDRENIESLAFALVQIIKARSTQKHFQLVIITHDEDFVELLGRSDFVEEYIKVSKNAAGVSRLTMKKVEDLHTNTE